MKWAVVLQMLTTVSGPSTQVLCMFFVNLLANIIYYVTVTCTLWQDTRETAESSVSPHTDESSKKREKKEREKPCPRNKSNITLRHAKSHTQFTATPLQTRELGRLTAETWINTKISARQVKQEKRRTVRTKLINKYVEQKNDTCSSLIVCICGWLPVSVSFVFCCVGCRCRYSTRLTPQSGRRPWRHRTCSHHAQCGSIPPLPSLLPRSS